MTPTVTNDLDTCLAHLACLHKHLRLAEAGYQAARDAAIPAEVQARLTDIDAAYLPQMTAWREAIAEAEVRLKALVKDGGHSVKGHGYHAVYHEGKVSWATKELEGYAAAH